VIDARVLVRRFAGARGQPPVEAVRGIDLSVAAGEMFGFLGPNGAGKTTTVRMLCALLPITTGDATVAGVDVRREPSEVRRRIGVALQEIGLDPMQTGRELLVLQAGLYRVRKPVARAQELLTLVGLDDAADRKISTYSGGMKRRLDLATALVHEPSVLFLDEPTTGLDPASRMIVWDEVRRINEKGTTIFLTTQYLEEADQLCERVAIIDGGRIVADGSPNALKAGLGGDVVTIGLGAADIEAAMVAIRRQPRCRGVTRTPDGLAVSVDNAAAALSDLVRVLAANEIFPETVAHSRPTLDDVFLATTGKTLQPDLTTTRP
jgi:ABC-2 type transport system ATP-binding protein